ncbi:hypothetical protein D3C84_908990 [compost metagenome]
MPSPWSFSTSASTPLRVLANTSTCFHLPLRIRCTNSSGLRFLSTVTIHCLTVLAATLRGLTSTVSGSLSICPASRRMSSEKVAENNSV